jgi:hypothetical protein
MSSVVAQISLASLASRPSPIEEHVHVGKDILDLLTGSMYLDPLSVYREYVQNGADSIDEARSAGMTFPSGPQMEIFIDHHERSIRIRDYGAAIPGTAFISRLTSIGGSGKRGKKQRGFRGVGRLSGLGYCQELVFRSRASGEAKVRELRWDGRVLREKMRDTSFAGGLSEIVAAAITQTKLPSDGFPERFFEVELCKVQRLRNDLLLNEDIVRSYLSQVAPVPFHPSFTHAEVIRSHLARAGMPAPVQIRLDGDDDLIYHRARDGFPLSDAANDSIQRVELLDFRDSDGLLVATGWIGHHSYVGAVPRKLGLGGVRLRSGDIQVGDENILASLYPEPRFASWSIGDIHVLSTKIVPNGRRDEFEPGIHYSNLQSELAIIAKAISALIRKTSAQRNVWKSLRNQVSAVEGWLHLAQDKKIPPLLRKVICGLASKRIATIHKDAVRTDAGPDDSLTLSHRIDMAVSASLAVSKNLQRSAVAHPLHDNSAMYAALETILTSSSRPEQVVKLASDVLAAVESTLPDGRLTKLSSRT